MKRIGLAFIAVMVISTLISTTPKSAQAGGGDPNTVNGNDRRACPLSVGWCPVSVNEAVVGARININGVEQNGCYVAIMPSSGWVMAGAINPWPGEINVGACSAFTPTPPPPPPPPPIAYPTNPVGQNFGFSAGTSVLALPGGIIVLNGDYGVFSNCWFPSAPTGGQAYNAIDFPIWPQTNGVPICQMPPTGRTRIPMGIIAVRFNQGDTVAGDDIVLDDGSFCFRSDGTTCVVYNAPSGGIAHAIINPWPWEIPTNPITGW